MLYGENENEMMKQSETESVGGMRGRFPEVPGEQPSKVMREKWAREARLRLTPTQRSVLAGKVPASLEKDSASVDLTRFPAIPAVNGNEAQVNAREAMRAKIELDNAKNAKYQDSRLREIRDEIASELFAAMENRAGFMAKTLRAKHEVTGHAETWDGVAMFKEIETGGSTALATISKKVADEEFEKLKARKPMDGSSAEDLSKYFNDFRRDINPYMTEPKSDAQMCRFMFDSMPPSCFFLVDPKEDEAVTGGWSDDVTRVQECLMTIAAKVRGQMVKAGSNGVGLGAFACMPAVNGGAAAAFAGWAQPAGGGSGNGFRTLPPGQKCKEGTCTFNHGGKCWSSANFDGFISPKIYQDKPLLQRIETARQAHAKAINVPYVPLKKPKSDEQRAKLKQKKEVKKVKAAAAAAAAAAATANGGAAAEAGLFSTMAPAVPFGSDGMPVPSDSDDSDDCEYEDNDPEFCEVQEAAMLSVANSRPNDQSEALRQPRSANAQVERPPVSAVEALNMRDSKRDLNVEAQVFDPTKKPLMSEVDAAAAINRATEGDTMMGPGKLFSMFNSSTLSESERSCLEGVWRQQVREAAEASAAKQASAAMQTSDSAQPAPAGGDDEAVANTQGAGAKFLSAVGAMAIVVVVAMAIAMAVGGVGAIGAVSSVASLALRPATAVGSLAIACGVTPGPMASTAVLMASQYPIVTTLLLALVGWQAAAIDWYGATCNVAVAITRKLAVAHGNANVRVAWSRIIRTAIFVMASMGVIMIISNVPKVGAAPAHSTVLRAQRLLSAVEPTPGMATMQLVSLESKFNTIYLDVDTSKAMDRVPGAVMSNSVAAEMAIRNGMVVPACEIGVLPEFNAKISDGSSHQDIARVVKKAPLVVADTGAGRKLLPDLSLAIKGTVRKNTTAISTANGITVPEFVCDARLPVTVKHADGTAHKKSIRVDDAIVHPACAYVLVPVGAMAKTHGLGLHVEAWTGNAWLSIENEKIGPKGSVIQLLNQGVLLFPSADTVLIDAAVTHGTHGATTKVDYETIHARIMHRADVNIEHLHRCTADSPDWSKLVPKVKPACDSCLQGVHKSKPPAKRLESTKGHQAGAAVLD